VFEVGKVRHEMKPASKPDNMYIIKNLAPVLW
jgi:hypothetical protein